MRGLLDDPENVVLAQDEMLLIFEFDLAPGIFAEQDLVAGAHFRRNQLAVVVDLAFANRDNFAFLWFLLRRVRDDDAAFGLLLFLDALDQNAITQWSNLRHWGLAAS